MTTKLPAALAALALSGAAHAGVMTYSGYLQNASGQPVTTATTITFRFYPSAAGGSAVWEDAVTVVPNSDGWFSAVLGGQIGNPLDAADFGQPLWLGLQVATDAQEMSPRTRLGTAPYALAVDWTGVAGKPATFPVDPATVQSRVTGSCGAGQFITGVNQDGTVACAADQVGAGDISSVAAGTGLTGGGTSGDVALAVDTNVIQARVTGTCGASAYMTAISPSGAVGCQPAPQPIYYAPGTGLMQTGNAFAINETIVPRKDGTANQSFDGGTLFVDYTNNRVGVGTVAPGNALEVVGTAEADGFAYRTPKTATVAVNATAFTSAGTPTIAFVNYVHTTTAGQWRLYAPVSFPAGAVVTALTCEVYDNDATNDFQANASGAVLNRRPFGSTAGGQTLPSVLLNTTGASATLQTRSAVGTHAVDAASEYFLNVFLTGSPANSAELRFYGCRVTYTTTAPAY